MKMGFNVSAKSIDPCQPARTAQADMGRNSLVFVFFIYLSKDRSTQGQVYPRAGLPKDKSTPGQVYPTTDLPHDRSIPSQVFPRTGLLGTGLPKDRSTPGQIYPRIYPLGRLRFLWIYTNALTWFDTMDHGYALNPICQSTVQTYDKSSLIFLVTIYDCMG